MRRFIRALLVVGVLVGGLTFGTSTAEAGIFGRGFGWGGWGGYGGYGGYYAYRPAWGYGYGGYYPTYGYGWGGYGLRYPSYGYGYSYPNYYTTGYTGLGWGMGSYYGGWGSPYYGGTMFSIGRPYGGGMYMGAYPW